MLIRAYNTVKNALLAVFEIAKKSYKLLFEEKNRAAFSHILKNLFKLLKRLMPKKGSGYVKVGTGDPYSTGRLMELCSLLYPAYGEHIDVIPMFSESELSSELKVSGRFNLAGVLFPLLPLVFDKNVRRFVKEAREFSEEI